MPEARSCCSISALVTVGGPACESPPSAVSAHAYPFEGNVDVYWVCAILMARMDCCADVSLAYRVMLPMVGMAMSMRMAMIAMTISSSISVKPLAARREEFRPWKEKKFVRFIALRALQEAGRYGGPSEKNPTT